MHTRRNYVLKMNALAAGFCLALCTLSPLVLADDSEVFYGQASNLDDNNPNLLFVLDTSGSMSSKDGGTQSRMDRMKEAMRGIIDQSSSFNVGIMGFSGWGKGGAVRYPIGYLEGVSDDQCPDTGCPDEVVVSRVGTGVDDAVEDNVTGAVVTDGSNLEMAEVNTGETSLVIPAGATLVTESVPVSAVVTESIRRADNVIENGADEVWDSWFYHGPVADYTEQILGYQFDAVALPADAVVTEAFITFTFDDGTQQTGDLSAYIAAEANTAPAIYPDALAVPEPDPNPYLQDRALTSEVAGWVDIPAGTSNSSVDTPELRAVLQEVIGLPGWASGNNMSFVIKPFHTFVPGDGSNRQFHGSIAAVAHRPELTFTYFIDTTSTTTGTETLVASQFVAEYTDKDGNLQSLDTGAEFNLFNYGDGDDAEIAMLFENTNIPDGAEITSAFLEFTDLGTGLGTFKINVTAEESEAPTAYVVDALDSRTYVASFVEIELPDAAGAVTSPDLLEVIKEVRGATTWTPTSSLSLHVSKGADYLSDGSMNRIIATPASMSPPKLVINWKLDNSTTEDVVVSQTVGLRFQNMHIPPDAQIESAVLEFHSNSATDSPASLDIRGELVSNAASFSTAANDISGRATTIAGVNWLADPWSTVGTQFDSVDIKSIVQEQVNQADWCGGNALAVLISGTGLRDAMSYEKSTGTAPTLRVTYKPDTVPAGAYCSNRSSVVSMNEGNDDAVENVGNTNVSLTGAALDLVDGSGDAGEIALRFRDIPIPQGTTIVSAVLELTAAADMSAVVSADIFADDAADSQPLTSGNANISSRTPGATTVPWGSIPAVTAGSNIFSPDISGLISEVVGRTDWVRGNALTIHVQNSGGGAATSFHSFEGSEALSPKLILYYQDERSSPGTLFKENLKLEIDELVAQDGTPIVDAYLEAAYYYLGEPVHFGKQRGWQNSSDRNHRVSHPFSYTGGTVNRTGNCSDADLNSEDCRWETISGTPQYISPIEHQCQQNHIIYLSDGEATSNVSAADVRALTGDSTCSIADDNGNDQACGRELASWLAGTDHSDSLTGTQNVITHTIGFNLDSPAFLQALAQEGNGNYYSANSATDLLNAFKTIFNSVSKRDTSFVAPTASVNQFNRLKHREDIYFSLFKPETTARWDGNIKRYKLSGSADGPAVIEDFHGDPAVNAATGEFDPNSVSFWSSGSDGGVVTKGGAAAELDRDTARLVVTYTGSNIDLLDISNRISTANTDLTVDDFQLPPELQTDTAYVDDLVDWVAGFDVKDIDGDGDTTENRAQMGDPMHSQPLLLNYTSNGTTGDSVIFVATNEGYLHAIDHSNGDEHFAFVPQDLLGNMRYYYENEVTESRRYGLDGPITAWIKDTNSDGIVDAALGDKAYIYFGMRRGGRNYYALDVTDYTSPKWLWSIKGSEGDFTDLGQSWSSMSKTKVMDGSEVKDALIFAGGFDPNNHDASGTDTAGLDANGLRTDDFLGSALYIVDAETGDLIWKPDPNDSDFTKMKYSIPSDIRVIDINSDGMVDQLYVGDLGGQIWRLDINTSATSTDSIDSRIRGGVVADFGGAAGEANRRRFFYPPDLAVVSVAGTQKLSVSIGSGWRAHPLDLTVDDRFFNFRMSAVYGPPLDSDGSIEYSSITESTDGMVDVTSTLNTDPTANIGWYFDLGADGEKVLASSITYNNQVVFTSYIPASASDSCSAAVGSGRVYAVDVLSGDPVSDLDDGDTSDPDSLTLTDRWDELNTSGIPPGPTILFPETGDAVLLLGPEVKDGVNIADPKRRTFWVEHVDSMH